MNDPVLYSKNKEVQVETIQYIFRKYFELVKLQPEGDDQILDVGCGDGEVSVDLLLAQFPKKCQKLVGCDISEKMINFASKKYENNKQVSFVKLDISTKNFPKQLEQKFHHVFSFYCLHWIPDQIQTMKNIYKAIKPGGDFTVTINGPSFLYTLYKEMAKNIKWTKYLPDIENVITSYYNKKDPVRVLEDLLKSSGFSVPICKKIEGTFSYKSVDDFKNFLFGISPFVHRIPENEITDFWCDLLEATKTIKLLLDSNKNKDEKYTIQYSLLFAFAVKHVN